jgi:hypothetical protein
MVAHPAEDRWPSYRANRQGETDALVKPHPLHTALGLDAPGRQARGSCVRNDRIPRSVPDVPDVPTGKLPSHSCLWNCSTGWPCSSHPRGATDIVTVVC